MTVRITLLAVQPVKARKKIERIVFVMLGENSRIGARYIRTDDRAIMSKLKPMIIQPGLCICCDAAKARTVAMKRMPDDTISRKENAMAN